MPVAATGRDAEVISAEWRRRTESEYTSAAIAQQVTLWLIQLGAPPDLIRDGLGVVADELAHSELSAVVADRAGGSAGAPVIDPGSLVLDDGGDRATALVSSILRFFCIGETLAVPLFRMLHRRCSVPVALRALDRVLRDETRHRQFGWDVLDWTLLVGGLSVRNALVEQAPVMLEEVASAYAFVMGNGVETEAAMSPNVLAWGLAPASDYFSTVSTALAGDVQPRLVARGVLIS